MLPSIKKMDLSKQYQNTLEEMQTHLIKAVEAMLTVLFIVTIDQEQEQYAQKIGTLKDSTPHWESFGYCSSYSSSTCSHFMAIPCIQPDTCSISHTCDLLLL